MIFWKKSLNNFLIYFIGLCIEMSLVFYIAQWKFLLILVCILPVHLFLSQILYKSHRFNSHIFCSLIFYFKAILFLYGIVKLAPYVLNGTDPMIGFTAYFVGFFVSCFYKIIFNIGYFKKSKTIMLCSSENEYHYFSLYPTIAGKIYTENDNNYIDIIKQKIEKNNVDLIVDTYENYIHLLHYLNSNYTKTNIQCLEAGNNDLFSYFLTKHCVSFKEEPAEHNFFGARILIIGNNDHLILSFIEKSYQLECSSVVLLTDNPRIAEKFNNVCKSVLFAKDTKLKEIESKYAFDIIFDTYIMQSYNFNSYRMIMREVEDVIKNKKAIVSIVKQGMFVGDWLFNAMKEVILKRFHESCYGLSSVVFRCGEFSDENFFPLSENFIIFQDFSVQSPKDIANSSWKTLWTIEKGTLNIISNSIPLEKKAKSDIAIKIYEQKVGNILNFEIFEYINNEQTETLDKYFLKHKTQFNHSTKALTNAFFDKTVITSEDIAKALL